MGIIEWSVTSDTLYVVSLVDQARISFAIPLNEADRDKLAGIVDYLETRIGEYLASKDGFQPNVVVPGPDKE